MSWQRKSPQLFYVQFAQGYVEHTWRQVVALSWATSCGWPRSWLATRLRVGLTHLCGSVQRCQRHNSKNTMAASWEDELWGAIDLVRYWWWKKDRQGNKDFHLNNLKLRVSRVSTASNPVIIVIRMALLSAVQTKPSKLVHFAHQGHGIQRCCGLGRGKRKWQLVTHATRTSDSVCRDPYDVI